MKTTATEGFTLIEIVIAVMIMTLLVGIAAPSFMGTLNSERVSATENELESITSAVLRYVQDTAKAPPSLEDLYSSSIPGFGGPYIDDGFGGRPVAGDGYRYDAWGRPYRMTTPSATLIRLTSAGKDGSFDTSDDIQRDVNIRPTLLTISSHRLSILNQAVRAYNALKLPDHPLPSSTSAALSTLVSGGFLPSDPRYASDAFGDPWLPVGVPVVEFRSPNFGTVSPGGG